METRKITTDPNTLESLDQAHEVNNDSASLKLEPFKPCESDLPKDVAWLERKFFQPGRNHVGRTYDDIFLTSKLLNESPQNLPALQSFAIKNNLVYIAPVLTWDAATIFPALESGNADISRYIGFDLIQSMPRNT